MSIHKSKGLEFPVVFLSGTGKQFNMQDLNNKILLHPEIGIGVKYIDYEKKIEYDTLSKQAMRNQIMIETLSEEMRVLYVALTRAKEKLIITGYSKNDTSKQEEMETIINSYEKLNDIVLKKYKSYLDWIRLVYLYNQTKIEKLVSIQIYNKNDVIKMCKINEETKQNNIDEILNKLSKIQIDKAEQKKIVDLLEYQYKYKISTIIPTKTSVTELKRMKQNEILEDVEIEMPKPKFLQNNEEIKITNAEKGTLIHLCMQKLNLSKKLYTYGEIKELVEQLEFKKIITKQEADSINISKVFKFTQSNIWKELVSAKLVEREKPFYISLPIKEIYGEDVNENILVQGIIDLYYIDQNDNLVLVDYKTDFVENKNEQVLIDKYRLQLELYKNALESSLNRSVDKIYIYSTFLDKEILL